MRIVDAAVIREKCVGATGCHRRKTLRQALEVLRSGFIRRKSAIYWYTFQIVDPGDGEKKLLFRQPVETKKFLLRVCWLRQISRGSLRDGINPVATFVRLFLGLQRLMVI